MAQPGKTKRVHLAVNRPLALPPVSALSIHCLAGLLWLTESGCQEDIFLAPGDCFHSTGKARIVVESLEKDSEALISQQKYNT